MSTALPVRRVLAVLSALLLLPNVASLATAPDRVELPGSVAASIANALPTGLVDDDVALDLVVALRMRDPDGLDAAARAGGLLSHDETTARFAPDEAALARVISWLVAEDVGVRNVSSDRTLIQIQLSAADARRVFGTQLAHYEVSGRHVQANGAPVLLPRTIARDVQAIVGLTAPETGAPPTPATAASESPSGFTPALLRQGYGLDAPLAAGADGSGVRVALVGSPPNQTWLARYSETFGLPPMEVTIRRSFCSEDGRGDISAQLIHAMAPRAALDVYCEYDSAGYSWLLWGMGDVVADNVADVATEHAYYCELDIPRSDFDAFASKIAQSTAQGQAWFFTAGRGNLCGNPGLLGASFPANVPYVASVGISNLTLQPNGNVLETVWNTCQSNCGPYGPETSGGAPSYYVTKPTWERTSAEHRATVDVTAHGGAYVAVVMYDNWVLTWGTISADLAAGMWADVISRTGRLGSASETVWSATADGTILTRDVTAGRIAAYAAGPGYDYPSGLGSFNVSALVSALTTHGSPPRLFTVTPGVRNLTLHWQPPVVPAAVAGYRIYRGQTPGSLALLAETANVTTYVDALPNRTMRYYRVSAVSALGESPTTGLRNATVFDAPTAPTMTGVSTSVPGALTPRWSGPADEGGTRVTAYILHRRDSTHSIPTTDPSAPTRFTGSERAVLALDADDADGSRTRDARWGSTYRTNGLTPTTGRFGGAYEFHGSGSYLELPGSQTLYQGGLSMWVKPSVHGGQAAPYGTQRLLGMGRSIGDAVVYLDANGSVVVNMSPTQPPIVGNSSLPLGEWSHVAIDWNRNVAALYVDGELDGFGAGVGPSAFFGAVYAGNVPAHLASGGFLGVIDDVRTYELPVGREHHLDAGSFPYATPTEPLVPIWIGDAVSLSRYDDGLADNTTYWYAVSAVNAAGEGPRSAEAFSVTPWGPGTSSRLQVVRGAPGELVLTWAPPSGGSIVGVTGYQLYRSSTIQGNGALVAQIGNVTTYTHTGLGASELWYYRVAAVYADHVGALSDAALGITAGPPSQPQSPKATPGPAAGQVLVSWKQPVFDGGAPVLGYGLSADGVNVSVGNTTSWIHTGLPASSTHAYQIWAINALGAGTPTVNVSATTFSPPTAPPTALAATPGPAAGQVRLTWNAPSLPPENAATIYHVYQDGALVGSTQQTSYHAAALSENTTYVYRVRGANAAGMGPASADASARTYARPASPAVIGASGPQIGQATVSWNAPAYDGGAPVSGYDVYAGSDPAFLDLVATTTSLSFTASDLSPGDTHHFRVAARNLVGAGALGPLVSARVPAVPPPPPAQVRVSGSIVSGEVSITWDEAGATEPGLYMIQGYRVYRAVDGEDERYVAFTTSLSYQDPMCPLGSLCLYSVESVGLAGGSGPSVPVGTDGVAAVVTTRGAASADAAHAPRYLGHELTILQADADDMAVPELSRDASIWKNPGQLHGVRTGPGAHGSALRWTGLNQWVSLRDSAMANLPEGSVMVWIKMDGLADARGHILHKALPGSWSEFMLGVRGDGSLYAQTSDLSSPMLRSAPGTVAVGEWTHVAMTFGAEGKRLYLDGVLVAWDADTTGVGVETTTLELGASPGEHATTGFFGSMDELRIYDVQLGEGDIASILRFPYAASSLPTSGPPGSPV